jgi:hypothetical protein
MDNILELLGLKKLEGSEINLAQISAITGINSIDLQYCTRTEWQEYQYQYQWGLNWRVIAANKRLQRAEQEHGNLPFWIGVRDSTGQ